MWDCAYRGMSTIRQQDWQADRKRKAQWSRQTECWMDTKHKEEKKDAMTGICCAFIDLKLLVHLLQLCHGVPEVRLQLHAALICVPLRLPEQNHLLLQTLGVLLLRLTSVIRCHQPTLFIEPRSVNTVNHSTTAYVGDLTDLILTQRKQWNGQRKHI